VSGVAAALALALVAAPGAAQQQAPSPDPTPAPVSPEYTLGPGDILDVTVFGNEDLSRTATVQTNGAITVPLLGEVAVAGLSIDEVKGRLQELYGRDYLVNPQVEVRVREYVSQSVIVVGEVVTPGKKPLKGSTRLIDALVEAGGFKPSASGEVVVTRSDGSFEDGTGTLRLRVASANPGPRERAGLEVRLRNGDIVTALPKYYVTVEGEVSRPNRYPLEGDLTVTGAISLAGGLTRFGASDVKVRRTDPESGASRIIDVDLKAVRRGKQPDLPLQPNDVVTVPRRLF
jgi:polysaccharide export outer membrane protein